MTQAVLAPDRAAADSRTEARRYRAAVSLAFLANGVFVGSWAPQIPIFAARLGLTPATMGPMILLFGLGAVAIMPVVGRFVAARGSRPPMLVLHLMLVLTMPFLVLADTLWLGALAILFAGFATGGMDVAMNANAVVVERRRAGAIMSSCHGFWSVGGLVGAALGGFLIAKVGPTAHGLLIGAATLAAFFPVRAWSLRDAPGGKPAAAAAAPDASPGAATGGVAGTSLVSGYRGALIIGVLALFAMIPEGAAIDWSAFYLRRELGAAESLSGFAFAAFSATMAIFRFAGDAVRDRLGAVSTMRWCSAAAALGLVIVGLAPNAPLAFLGFAVMGVGISNIVPIAFSAAGNLGGLRAGVGLSTVSALGYSGILVAPAAIGWFGEHVGFSLVFLCLSSFLVVTFIAAPAMKVADRDRP